LVFGGHALWGVGPQSKGQQSTYVLQVINNALASMHFAVAVSVFITQAKAMVNKPFKVMAVCACP